MKTTSKAAFETVLETHLLENGYVSVPREGFDRERAIFPETAKLDALRAAERTIELLKERRAALVAAAVKGKMSIE